MINEVLGSDLPQLTKATITKESVLRRELTQARQPGPATCWQESEVGLSSVAVRRTTTAVSSSRR